MFTTPSMFTLVSALVGAGAHAPDGHAAAAAPLPLPAVAAIRRARPG